MKNWIVAICDNEKRPCAILFLKGTKAECRRHAQIMADMIGEPRYAIQPFPKSKRDEADKLVDRLINLFR